MDGHNKTGDSVLITKEEFLEKYNISKDTFIDADMSWEELGVIYKDFSEKTGRYGKILNELFCLRNNGKSFTIIL